MATSAPPSAPASASTPTASSTAVPTPSSSTTAAADPTRAQAEARAAVLASLNSAGSNYSSALQSRAIDLHANSAAIAKQEVDVSTSTAALEKESRKLAKEVDKTMKGMREMGDMQNWAEMLERDFMVLEETLRLAEGGEEGGLESGGSTWR